MLLIYNEIFQHNTPFVAIFKSLSYPNGYVLLTAYTLQSQLHYLTIFNFRLSVQKDQQIWAIRPQHSLPPTHILLSATRQLHSPVLASSALATIYVGRLDCYVVHSYITQNDGNKQHPSGK